MRCLAILALAAFVSGAQAQQVDAATRRQVVERTIEQVRAAYVDAGAGAMIEAALRRDPRAFDALDDGAAFAERLTAQLQAVVPDRHLHVEYSAQPLPSEGAAAPDDEAQRRADDAGRNHGVERVEHLPGNIGYLDLRSFSKPAWAADALAAAMTLVAPADALIVDLRSNGGGYPATATLVESYLFDKRTHVVDVYWRDGDRTEQFWTQDTVPGARFGQAKPVYVLTSRNTFSGAEQFTYDLKNLKRATVVGETTGGGANPGKFVTLAPHFGLMVPTGRAVSPITHGNWERTGVEPDVKVEAGRALVVAQQLALERLIAAATDAEHRAALQARLGALR